MKEPFRGDERFSCLVMGLRRSMGNGVHVLRP